MSVHYNDVLDYLDEHPIYYYEGSIKSLLELVHEFYTMYNSIDSEALRARFRQLEDILCKLTLKEQDAFFDTVNSLCLESEQLAFSHGVVVGMHMMTDINSL